MEAEFDTVVLQSMDGEEFRVETKVASMSGTVRNYLEDGLSKVGAVPLPEVSSKILRKIVEYCKYHTENPTPELSEEEKAKLALPGIVRRTDDIIEYDAEFCKVDQDTLFEIIMAANYLDLPELLDLTCKVVALQIKGKTPEEIRAMYGLCDDLTPEEKQQIIEENRWCEEQ